MSDILQEARLAAHLACASFEPRGEGSVRAWLTRIAELKAYEAVRRFTGVAKRDAGREATHDARPNTDQLVGHEPSPSQAAIAVELTDAVRRALDRLPDDYREVLHLIAVKGLTFAVAGDRMARTGEAVRKLYGRALRASPTSSGLSASAPMSEPSREDRIQAALVAWRERRERDPNAESGEWLAAHPDLAEDLAARLAAERLLPLAFRGWVSDPPPAPRRLPHRAARSAAAAWASSTRPSRSRCAGSWRSRSSIPRSRCSPQATERFRREAQAAGRIHHTNIVPVFAMGEEAGCWYYAMERVSGPDSRRDRGRPAASRRRARARRTARPPGPAWARRAAGGSSTCGSREPSRAWPMRSTRPTLANVVHRDIKPSNLMLDDDGTLKITDFGLARMDGELPTVTATGALIGTPAYMSPEQIRPGDRPLDGRTDVYSLGRHALRAPDAARGVPRGPAWRTCSRQILRGSPASPRAFERRIPRDLETIVLKAMERDPERRYRTAGDMGRDLLLFAEGAAIRAKRASLLVRMGRGVRKHRRAAASVAVVLLAGGVALWALVGRAQEHEQRTELEYDKSMRRVVGQVLEVRAQFEQGWLSPPQ